MTPSDLLMLPRGPVDILSCMLYFQVPYNVLNSNYLHSILDRGSQHILKS